MRLSESTRSLQQYNGKIGDSAFLAGRFLYIIPIGPNKVDNQIWQTVSSYYMRAPILGEFDGRCESCEDCERCKDCIGLVNQENLEGVIRAI